MSQRAKNLIIGRINQMIKVDKIVSPMDVIFDMLDGSLGKYQGANYRNFKQKVDYDFGQYLDLKDELQNPVVKMANDLKMKQTNFERIGTVAAREQDGGMEKLIQLGYSEKEVNAIKLTSDEQKLLNKMREVFDSQFPAVSQLSKDLYNQPVGKVKNYFSFMTDFKQMDDAEVFQRFGPNAQDFTSPTKNVEKGFLQKRVFAGKQKIQLNAMDVFLRHTDNVSYFQKMAKDAKMLFEVANSGAYKESAGDIGQLLVLEWLDLVARKGGMAGANQIAVIDMLRKNLGSAMLGFKLSSALIQWTPLIDAAGMIGPQWSASGAVTFATSKEWRQFITQFPEVRKRIGDDPLLREMVEGNWLEKLQAKSFIPLQEIDKATATSVTIGSYQKKMAEMGKKIDLTGKPNKEAMEYAQLMMRRTQSSSMFKDTPLALSRGALTGNRSIDKALFQFQNFVLTEWSRLRHDAWRVGIKTKDPIKAANIMFWMLMATLAVTGTRYLVQQGTEAVFGKKSEQSKFDFWKRIAMELGGKVPFMGNILGSYMYDNELIPIFEQVTETIAGADRAVNSKSSQAKAKGINQFLTGGAGIFLGVPGMLQTRDIIDRLIGPTKTGSTSSAIPKRSSSGGRLPPPP
jgi:hypothetical protein